MTQTYEAWRITYQSSEQAARAAFERMMELKSSKCLHQIAEPAAPVVKPIKDAIDALVMAAFTEGGCSEHRMSEARIQTELRKKELRTLLSTPQPCSRSHPHEEMTPMCELRTEIARLTNALARAEAQLAAAPQAVQPAIMPKGESAAAQLRAMATNYPAGHSWDKLDARACIRGALEIEALRALLAAAPAHPAEGVPTSSDLRERLARLEAGCNAHTTPTVYEAIADSKAALDELDEARQRVGISLAATQPAAQGLDATKLLAEKHTGMKVDYRGLLGQVRRAIKRTAGGHEEMLRQLEGHITELGQRWYAGDTAVVDELLQLYCVERQARADLAAQAKQGGA